MLSQGAKKSIDWANLAVVAAIWIGLILLIPVCIGEVVLALVRRGTLLPPEGIHEPNYGGK